MIIVLRRERPPSWNKFYAGVHWTKRKRMMDDIHLTVRAAIDPNWQPFDVPVDIILSVYFQDRPQDADNVCSKPYIDALIGWVIHDDKPAYVRSVTTVSLIDKYRPRLEIEIRAVNEKRAQIIDLGS